MKYKFMIVKFQGIEGQSILTEDMVQQYATGLHKKTMNNSFKTLEEEGLAEITYRETTNLELYQAILNQDFNKIQKLIEDE